MLESVDADWDVANAASAHAHQAGDLAEMGVGGGWGPSSWMIHFFEHVYILSGLPWWGTIALATVIFRMTFFPLMLRMKQNQAIMPYFKDEAEAVKRKVNEARASHDLAKAQKIFKDELTPIYEKHGYQQLLPFLGFIQFPFMIGAFIGIRKMTMLPVPSMQMEGALWFTDLTVPDPTFIIPLLSGVTMTYVALVLSVYDTVNSSFKHTISSRDPKAEWPSLWEPSHSFVYQAPWPSVITSLL
jgi:YidC/Oxa1 family membrane protein insertase